MSEPISWHVELEVRPGRLDALRALTAEMIERAKAEPGTLIYERYVSDDQRIVHVLERYADSAAAVAHLADFAREYAARLAELIERRRFTVFGTPTRELREILDPLGATYARAFP